MDQQMAVNGYIAHAPGYVHHDGPKLITSRFVHEETVDAGVFREFGMEGRGQDPALLHERRLSPPVCQDLDFRADPGNGRPADHDQGKSGLSQGRARQLADVAFRLASVGVPPDPDVQQSEGFLVRVLNFGGEQDRSGAGSVQSSSAPVKPDQRLEEILFHHQLQHRRAFPPGEDETIERGQICLLADFPRRHAESFERLAMEGEGPLEGEHSDPGAGVAVGSRHGGRLLGTSAEVSLHRNSGATAVLRGRPDRDARLRAPRSCGTERRGSCRRRSAPARTGRANRR